MLQSMQIAKKQGIERVVWIGSHIEILEYEYLCAVSLEITCSVHHEACFLECEFDFR